MNTNIKNLAATLIALTAIGVAVKEMNKKPKQEIKPLNTIYHGAVEPSTPIKDDVWFKPNGEMKKY